MEISKDEYDIVRLNENNLSDLVILYKSAFNTNASLKFFKEKFDTSFTGLIHIGYLAYSKHDKMPAAFYGVFPCFVEFKSKKLLAAQSGDTMTHANHRGKGLFTILAKKTYELAKENHVEFIFGFPNQNSYPGFIKKLDWTHTQNIRSYIFKVTTLPLAKAAKKFGLTSVYGIYARLILRQFVSKKKYIPNSLIDSEHGGVLHDQAFFQYKAFLKNFILEIEDIAMWVKLDGKLWIGDVERTDAEHFRKILGRLQCLCIYLGCTEIVFNTSPGSYWDNLLSKENTFTQGLPIGYLNFNPKIDVNTIYFTGADFDTF
jgi:hypothetical protein